MIHLHPRFNIHACSLLVSIVTMLTALPAFASKDSVPEWVTAAISQPKGTYAAETSAVVLLDEMTLTVGTDGKAVQRMRFVVRILRPSGREEGIVEVPYDKDTKILSLHIWSVGPDGHEYAMKDSEILDEGYAGGGGLYFDERFKVARAPGRDPGGVVAYEVEQRLAPYEHEATWSFQSDIPHVSQSFTLQVPPNFAYVTVFAHHAPVKAIDLEHQRYRWEMNTIPGIDLERVPMHPSGYALAGRMIVHFGPVGASGAPLGSWQGIGEWYDGLSRDRMVANPEIVAKATELAGGKGNPGHKIVRAGA